MLGALAVLGAAAALVVLVGSTRGEPAAAPPGGGTPVAVPRAVQPPPTERRPSVTVSEADQPRAATPEEVREYAVGDVRIRDHRAGDHAPLDLPPNIHPAESRLIPATLTQAISRKVKDVMRECLSALPPDARGDAPKVEGQVEIAIKDRQLTVNRSVMQLRDVTGDQLEPVRQCIETRAVGVSVDAGDEADLARYTINISYGFR